VPEKPVARTRKP